MSKFRQLKGFKQKLMQAAPFQSADVRQIAVIDTEVINLDTKPMLFSAKATSILFTALFLTSSRTELQKQLQTDANESMKLYVLFLPEI